MKVFLVGVIVPLALLVAFRPPNGAFGLADLEGFAHVCTRACVHIVSPTR